MCLRNAVRFLVHEEICYFYNFVLIVSVKNQTCCLNIYMVCVCGQQKLYFMLSTVQY